MLVREGDLLASPMPVIGHQVNLLGVMGAGIALQIRRRWPQVFSDYLEALRDGRLALGGIASTEVADAAVPGGRRLVVSLAGQRNAGTGTRQTNYEALELALRATRALAEQRERAAVGFPWGIGCGLAGGDWNRVERMIADVFEEYPCVLYRLP